MAQTMDSSFQSPLASGFPALPGADLSVGGRLARSQQAQAMGTAFSTLFGALWRMFNSLHGLIEEARIKSDVVSLSDRSLTDLGIRRGDIPAIITRGGLDQGVRAAVKWYLSAGHRTA